MVGVRGNFGRWWEAVREYAIFSSSSPELLHEFRAYVYDLTLKAIEILLVGMFILTVLFWPTDWVFFADEPKVIASFAIWRMSNIIIGPVILYLIRKKLRPFKRPRLLRRVLLYGSASLASPLGYALGRLGGLDEVFFYGIYPLLGLSIIVFVEIRTRVLMNVFGTVCFCTFYFVVSPEHLLHPRLPTIGSIMFCANFAFIAMGHFVYYLLFLNYSQQRTLEQQSLELQRATAMAERLLLGVLPLPVAKPLVADRRSIVDHYQDVGILFADFDGIADAASRAGSSQALDLVEKIFHEVDQYVATAGLNRLQSPDDTLVVVASGESSRRDPASAIADFALYLSGRLRDLNVINDGRFFRIQLRIGLHSSSVIRSGGGVQEFIYDLWNDTVVVGRSLERRCPPGKILVSPTIYQKLKDKYRFDARPSLGASQGPAEYFLLSLHGDQ